jgi:hypothetical protein
MLIENSPVQPFPKQVGVWSIVEAGSRPQYALTKRIQWLFDIVVLQLPKFH